MKAVVLEIRDGEAAVLREDGVVVRVRQKCEVGDTIEVAAEKERKIISFRSIRTMAAAACLALLLTAGGAYGYTTAMACTYVSVDAETVEEESGETDITGSVEYVLNRRNRVIRAESSDAAGDAIADELMRRGAKGMELSDALELAEEVLREQKPDRDGQESRMLVNVSAESAERRQQLVQEARKALEYPADGMRADVTENTLEDRRKAQEMGISAGRYEHMRREEPQAAEQTEAPVKEKEAGPAESGESVKTEPPEKKEEAPAGNMEFGKTEPSEKQEEAPAGTGESGKTEPAERKEAAPAEKPAENQEAAPPRVSEESGWQEPADSEAAGQEVLPAEGPESPEGPETGDNTVMEGTPDREDFSERDNPPERDHGEHGGPGGHGGPGF
ncbi:MAG: hypothetical protein K6E83_01660 [Clostridium sp.]|nr:hypothetical protein [Clostridium sp.]